MFHVSILVDVESTNMITFLIFPFLLLSVEVLFVTSASLTTESVESINSPPTEYPLKNHNANASYYSEDTVHLPRTDLQTGSPKYVYPSIASSNSTITETSTEDATTSTEDATTSTEDATTSTEDTTTSTEDTTTSTENTTTSTEDSTTTSTEDVTPPSTEDVTTAPSEDTTSFTEDATTTPSEDTTTTPSEDTTTTPSEDTTTPSEDTTTPSKDTTTTPSEDTTTTPSEDTTTPSEDTTTTPSEDTTTSPSEDTTTTTPSEDTTSTSSTEYATSPFTSTSTEITTSETSKSSDEGVNAGLAIGIVLAILLVGVGIVLWRAYSSGRNLWPPKNLFSNGTQDSIRPQPVPLKKFPAHCSEMLEVPSKLSHEYQLLATLSVDIYATESFVAAQMPDNKFKNRYVNILPFDSTRVKLSPEGDEEFYSDYINASYIKGYTNDIEYIATQGPKEETCRDFWRMVYQEPIKVIIMVTQLEEQGKPKCYKYFPNLRENMELDDIVVRCTTELHFPIYTSRTFILTKGERKRSITHLHFREWPDFGCPATPDLMLQFCQVMRQTIILAQPGITLVHCSAGVGRTGTLIAVDILMQHIKENKKIDIFGTVFKLRKHRMNMVQSETQYVYLYKCVKEALEDPSYLSSENSSSTSLEPIYENIECARLSSIPSKDTLDTVTNENECAF